MAKATAPASPSASVLLISPTNEILLLRRVQTSTSFASAHVFPGGHLSPQDGFIFPSDDVRRHEDSEAYRMAAIRECFEESGILLAKSLENPGEFLMLSDEERELGRRAIHQETISFQAWVKQRNGTPDIDNLIPFTRWLTPPRLSKRFTTQMYLYFLPLPSSPLSSAFIQSPSSHSPLYQIPTSDGGIEHTTANFLPPSEWLSQYARKEIILFFPQFYLLSLITPFFSPLSPPPNPIDIPTLNRQREALTEFTKTSDPPWGQKCLSSVTIFEDEKKYVNSLDHPGPELKDTLRKGDSERLMIIYKDQGEKMGGAPRFGLVLRKDFAVEEEKGRL